MKKLLPVLLLLLAVVAATAQEQDYPELIRKTRRYLSVFPQDNSERLSLAWYYMQNAQADSALVYYKEVLNREPANPSAASGTLWALNSLYRYPETLGRSDSLIRAFPENPNIFSHRGLALLQTYSPLKARSSYQSAAKLSAPGSASASIAADGLAWSYLNSGDFASAEHIVSNSPGLGAFSVVPWLERTSYAISGGIGYKQNGDLYYLGGASFRRKTLSAALGFGEYRYAGQHYRTAFDLELGKQFRPLDLEFNAKLLSGVDTGLYPAWQGGASATGKIYLASLRLSPLLSFRYTYAPAFSAAQADLGFRASTDRLNLLLMYSGLYLDYLAPGTDQKGEVFSGIADLRLYRTLRLSFSASHGDLAWWTNPYGVTLDSFYPNATNLGLGLYLPLGSRFGLSIYSQLGLLNDTSNYLLQSVLTLAL
jgi:tetratricopeptide (TPR) repeat protein